MRRHHLRGDRRGLADLASVLDLGSRRLVGWAMDATMPASLVAEALNRGPRPAGRGGRRRGVPFGTGDRNTCLGSTGISATDTAWVQSAGRVATCYDNSARRVVLVEPQAELVHRYRFATRAEAKVCHHRLDQALQQRQAPLEHRVCPADRVGAPLPSQPSKQAA